MNGEGVLREAASLVRRGWCCGTDARDCSGTPVDASDPDASSWSLPGALARASEQPGASLSAVREALWGIAGVISDSSLEHWNDLPGRTQEQTLDMLARAGASLNGTRPAD